MYQETNSYFEKLAVKKRQYSRRNPVAFFVQSMMAGAYVGIGIILIFSVAAQLDPSIQKLVMCLSFGVALTLVVFAGAELFTGYTMYFTTSVLRHKSTVLDTLSIWGFVWWGNLAGSIMLAGIYFLGHGPILSGPSSELLMTVASYKMNSGALELIARGTLCNWLVCLAIWMAARVESDSAKAIVIFWALFAFISSGYEHSVANMTLFSLALLGDHPESVSLFGMANNLFWVSIGNVIGGGLFMSVGYHLGSENLPSSNAADDYAEDTTPRHSNS